MNETPANPFASPEIEEIAAYSGPAYQTKSLGRWIGLSTLSGILLFAAYFVVAMAICILTVVLLTSPMSLTDVNFLAALGIYCAIAGVYGVIIGFIVGVTFGTITYRAPAGRGTTTLRWFGLPFAVLITLILPVGYLIFVLWTFPDSAMLFFWIWSAVMGLFSLIAAMHLMLNIRRFLINPLVEAADEVGVS
ncbi:hypothetical protein [Blastopirellula marina]|uniref:Uncharacterized protein n=1 Tax=Blastopirellula marina TaxID=124 RepID=A0A2S8GRL3_9BACT|nr:hypothetical protein [Blastopirellula marina]PQO47042.1 hypothetical protein C5Y93_05995 [Blastopirellula marina]